LTRRLAQAGERVASVRESFAPELARLDERRAAAAAKEAECHSKQTFLKSEQAKARQEHARIEQHITVVAEAISRAEALASGTRTRADDWQQQVRELVQQAQRRRALVEAEDAAQAEIGRVRGLLEGELQAKEAAAQRILDVQQHVSRARTDLASIDAQLPGLEERKKLAVVAKNFKEAGRLAGDVKALVARREELGRALLQHNDALQQVWMSVMRGFGMLREMLRGVLR
jgi:chromosome segregation ATPase